jgi:hypothetical protein
MSHQVGEFEIAKAKSATEALKHAQAYGSPSEIVGARREAEMARLALIAVKPEAAALDELRKALLHPMRIGARKKR